MKPDNIGFDQNGTVKLFDFGLARRVSGCRTNGGGLVDAYVAGAYRYMAPECMSGNKGMDLASDVYSFGIVMWEVCTLEAPYESILRQRMMGRGRKEKHSLFSPFDHLMRAVLDDQIRPSLSDVACFSTRDLLQKCWAPDPTSRPSFTSISHMLEIILTQTRTRQEDVVAKIGTDFSHEAHSDSNSYAKPFVEYPLVDWSSPGPDMGKYRVPTRKLGWGKRKILAMSSSSTILEGS